MKVRPKLCVLVLKSACFKSLVSGLAGVLAKILSIIEANEPKKEPFLEGVVILSLYGSF